MPTSTLATVKYLTVQKSMFSNLNGFYDLRHDMCYSFINEIEQSNIQKFKRAPVAASQPTKLVINFSKVPLAQCYSCILIISSK